VKWDSENPGYKRSNVPDWGDSVLAVSNDERQIFILQIFAPYEGPSFSNTNWTTQLLLEYTHDHPQIPESSWSFEDLISNRRYLNHMTWSPWVVQSGQQSSLLAFFTTQDIQILRIVAARGDHGLELSSEKVSFKLNIPMQIAPTVTLKWTKVSQERVALVASIYDEIVVATLNVIGEPAPKLVRRPRDDWAEITGTLLDRSANTTN
jgi:hypothetical protein